jgi:hypothetical protein
MNRARFVKSFNTSRYSTLLVVAFACALLTIAGCGERPSRVVTENDQWTFEDVRRMSDSDSEGESPQ